MDTHKAIQIAHSHLLGFAGHTFDVLDVSKPVSTDAAIFLTKTISKLSPLVGNLIEFNIAEFLNGKEEFQPLGRWKRQDPGFPDTIFEGAIIPAPGFEIKAWFPLGTEITARFKDSQNHFLEDQTYVAMLAWLPEHLIYGKPRILDVCVVSGMSVAAARDKHYHKPPDYLVLEPEDTSSRTANLQQSNTNGYKFQGSPDELHQAQMIVDGWGDAGRDYSPSREYQSKMRELLNRFTYRLDTNFAKMDRIEHDGIERFKRRVYDRIVHGRTVKQWNKLLFSDQHEELKTVLKEHLRIQDKTEDVID